MEARTRSVLVAVCSLAAFAALIAFAALEPRRAPAVPPDVTVSAEIPDLPGVRYTIGDERDMARLRQELVDGWARQHRSTLEGMNDPSKLPPGAFLALSGGGDGGAYGAGLLNGWSRRGDRPEFVLVTGISTGALIAPFAFLGPKYDPLLETLYTRTPRDQLVRSRHPFAAVTNDAVDDTAPLRSLLDRFVNRQLLDEIAAEYSRGRQLWISTVDIDARRRVIWNMTRIASSPHPRALVLFREVMLASAAIPGAFPPVMIEVEAGGRRYQEMHVDGGAMSQVFIYPTSIELQELALRFGATRERRLYVILNGGIRPDWAQTNRRAITIAGRAIDALIHSQGLGDLYRIYLECERDQIAFNLAYVPDDFSAPRPEPFDTGFMRALFKRGYDDAVAGYPWHRRPPGFETTAP